MAKKDFTTPLTLNGDYPNLDDRYTNNGDPYVSKSAAETVLASKLNAYYIGLTVLVKESGWTEAKEYWVQPKGTTPETYGLVEKGAGTTDYNDLENKPTIGDGTNTALPIVGNVKVSASTASGSTAGVTVTPGQNTGEIEMQFTLPKGDKGADGADGADGATPTINQTTKHWEIGGSDTGVLAEGHNPNLGTYLDTDPKPTTGQAGDYIYVVDTSVTPRTANVWAWNGTAFADTGKSVENFGLSFGSGQSVPVTKIKDENGVEAQGPADVLSAEAGAKMSQKVAGEFGHAVNTLAINNGAYVKFFDTNIQADTVYGIDISSNKDWTRVLAVVNRGKENELRIIDETATRSRRMAIFKADRTIESITVYVTTADSSQSNVTVEVSYNLERRLDSFETTGKALVTTPIIPFDVLSGKKLGFNGGGVTDASYQLVRYRVYAGDVLNVTASKDSYITLLFQDQANVPMNTANTHIVGRTFSVSIVDELIKVPSGATYMIVSQLIRDPVTYSVERVFRDDAARGIDTVYSEPVQVISSNYSFCHVLRFEEGEHYQIEVSLSDALSSILGVNIRTADGVSLGGFSLQAGTTTGTFNYVAPQTYEGVIIGYSFFGTAAGTISIRVSSSGMIARLAGVQDSVGHLLDNPYVIAINRKLDTINDLVDNYSGLANGDYVLVGKQLFIKVTDSTALPDGGYVWDNSILKRGVVYNVGGAVYVYDGVNVVESVGSIAEISQSTNLYDESKITDGRTINESGTITHDNNYLVTDYIRVEEGDILSCWWKKDSEFSYFTKPKMRYICAFGLNKNVIQNAGASEVTSYTVPSGIAYVRITLYKKGDNNGAIFKSDGVTRKVGFRINKGAIKPYEDYFYGIAPKWGYETKHKVDKMLGEPLGMMTEDIVNTLSYKRLGGPLEHGYFILSTDDGGVDMARYTVPLAIDKGIPVSFCIMSASHCLRTDLYQVEGDNTTPTLRDMVLDAVNNHGCEIIQHGAVPWAANLDNSNQHYSLWELREFFASEKAFWATLNVDVRGAAVPELCTSNAVKIITGGLFGMCRCAYSTGTNPTTHVFESGGHQYTMYFNGPKSNLYSMTSQNYTDFPLVALKAAVDYAVLHNYILIFHFHERELDEAKKEKLESLIDYAKTTDIVFTRLGDVPYLE